MEQANYVINMYNSTPPPQNNIKWYQDGLLNLLKLNGKF